VQDPPQPLGWNPHERSVQAVVQEVGMQHDPWLQTPLCPLLAVHDTPLPRLGWPHEPLPSQTSLVHLLPSSGQAKPEPAFGCWHPDAGAQESAVHGLLSLQFGGGPPVQVPFWQVSPVVHWFPSSQLPVLIGFEQRPFAGSQVPTPWH
jgi:hypothetical protein